MSSIVVRRPKFGIRAEAVRAQNEPNNIDAAFFAALSATFPDGEGFFVRSVRRFAHRVDPKLAADVAAFATQEAHHAGEHRAFNALAVQCGFDLNPITEHSKRHLAEAEKNTPPARLATTLALEHFTASLSREILRNPRHLERFDMPSRNLWRWHALEEIEHKAVAFSVFEAIAADWSPLRRWLMRCWAIIDALARVAAILWTGMRRLLPQTSAAAILYYFYVAPGPLRAIALDLLYYFRPGFHPNDYDDSAMIAPIAAEVAELNETSLRTAQA